MNMQRILELQNGLRHQIQAIEANAMLDRTRIRALENALADLLKEVRGK